MVTNRKRSKSEWIIAAASSIAALIAGVATFFVGSTRLFHTPSTVGSTDIEFVQRIETLRKALAEQASLVEHVSSRVNAIAQPPPESQLAIQMATMRADVESLDKRLKAIEQAVVDSPGKALSVPLLRQELEAAKASSQRDLEAQAKQIDRIYDQNKWFIGLMFTMAVGLIGLAVSNFLQARKSE